MPIDVAVPLNDVQKSLVIGRQTDTTRPVNLLVFFFVVLVQSMPVLMNLHPRYMQWGLWI